MKGVPIRELHGPVSQGGVPCGIQTIDGRDPVRAIPTAVAPALLHAGRESGLSADGRIGLVPRRTLATVAARGRRISSCRGRITRVEELRVDSDWLTGLCEEYSVGRLQVFGSLVSGDAAPGSDVDVLVTSCREGGCRKGRGGRQRSVIVVVPVLIS
jgi:hypothetical protein